MVAEIGALTHTARSQRPVAADMAGNRRRTTTARIAALA